MTRWLAHHVSKQMPLVDLEDVPVRRVLPEEEKRQNWLFATRRTTVDEVRMLFSTKKLLEAVLITETGKHPEKPIGIVTRWDVLLEG